jgi:hypothetical protein
VCGTLSSGAWGLVVSLIECGVVGVALAGLLGCGFVFGRVLLEFFVPTDLGAAREFKFPVDELFVVIVKLLFGFVKDFVIVAVGSGFKAGFAV